MAVVNENAILDAVTRYYLESRDFNGMDVASLIEITEASWDELRPRLERLVESGLLGVLSAAAGNSHVVRVGFPDTVTQISSLAEPSFTTHACIRGPNTSRPSLIYPFLQPSRTSESWHSGQHNWHSARSISPFSNTIAMTRGIITAMMMSRDKYA